MKCEFQQQKMIVMIERPINKEIDRVLQILSNCIHSGYNYANTYDKSTSISEAVSIMRNYTDNSGNIDKEILNLNWKQLIQKIEDHFHRIESDNFSSWIRYGRTDKEDPITREEYEAYNNTYIDACTSMVSDIDVIIKNISKYMYLRNSDDFEREKIFHDKVESSKIDLDSKCNSIAEANKKKEDALHLEDSIEKLTQLIEVKTELKLIVPWLESIDTVGTEYSSDKENYLNLIDQSIKIIDAFIEKLKTLKDIGKLPDNNTNDLAVSSAITNEISELIPTYISISDKTNLNDLLSINRCATKINWKKSKKYLLSTVNQWHDQKIIQYPTGTTAKEYILKNFTVKNNEINARSLNNEISTSWKR